MEYSASTIFSFLVKFSLLLLTISVISWWGLRKLHGKKKATQILTSSALVFISFCLALIASELIVRYIYKDITTTADNLSYFAERWKIKNPPNLNQYGFRDKEVKIRSSYNTYRIAIVGDSFAYGQGIPEKERFSNLIENHFQASGNNIEVLNFAKPGADTIDHIEFLKSVVLEVKPDFILLQWYVNDVEGEFPRDMHKPLRLIPSDVLSNFLRRKSALYYLANMQWQQIQVAIGLSEPDGYLHYLQRRYKDPDSIYSKTSDNQLRTFISISHDNNIPVGIVAFPLPLSGKRNGDATLGFLIDRVIQICKNESLRCVDLRPTFLSVQDPAKLKVNIFDGHPGKLANKLAANKIIEVYQDIWKRGVK